MTRSITRSAAALAALLLVAGAASAQSTGDADFTRYVALGDSLTHGFSSGGVVDAVQVHSYPALIARQAGVPDFQQPLISQPGIPPLLALQSLVPGPVIVPRAATPGGPTNLNLPRPYNNLGVAGFEVHDVLATVTGNGLIDTVLRGLGTPIQQAVALQPTFMTLWIGNNDVLAAATSGRVIDGVTLTPRAQFRDDYNAILGALLQRPNPVGRIAVATIPAVTALPFVTTIPPVVVNPATREPVLVNGQPVPLIGPDGPLSLADHVLLTASSLLAQGIGVPAALGGTNQPLPDDVVLNAAETAAIENRRRAYNDYIRGLANTFFRQDDVDAGVHRMIVVPIDTLFDDIVAHGTGAGGIEYTTEFLTGGIFSYDGVHPDPFGYALVANAFIDTINDELGASIPDVDLYPFIFGPDGSGGATVPVSANASAVVYAPSAYESLRYGLRVPSPAQLDRIVRRRQRNGDDPGAGDGPAGHPLAEEGGPPAGHAPHPHPGDME